MYIKVFDTKDEVLGVEEIKEPIFVKWQVSNDRMVRCDKKDAQGLIAANNKDYYLINGSMPHGIKENYTVEITKEEYDTYRKTVTDQEDPEDENPVIEDTEAEELPMTRKELTDTVKELRQENEFLSGCLLEMSEMVYV